MEPNFYAALLKGLGVTPGDLPEEPREDRASWPALRKLFTDRFRTKTRKEWEEVFDGTDACVTPVLSLAEGGSGGERPAVGLRATPGSAVEGRGGLKIGEGGERALKEWCGWTRGRDWSIDEKTGSWVKLDSAKL